MISATLEKNWEEVFVDFFTSQDLDDASHDLSHFHRVYKTAEQIARCESDPVDLEIVTAAAYLHDVVCLPKDHPECHLSSRYAAIEAGAILYKIGFPLEKIDAVCHAIEAHSFSACVTPSTIEAKIVQDADRMEALGALGIMRCFYVSGRLGREPYDASDLHASKRPLNDKLFGVDHFYVKLFKLPDLLQTDGGRKIAQAKVRFLHHYLKELESDLNKGEGDAKSIAWTCVHGGRDGLKLFDPMDPIAEKRGLDSTQFILDALLEKRAKGALADQFINQLVMDLRGQYQS